MDYDTFKYHKNLMIIMNEHFSKKLILQFLFIPFLVTLDLFFHELGHAIGWILNGATQISLTFDLTFPFKMTLHHVIYGEIIGINRIIISIMGTLFGAFFSLIILIVSKKKNLKVLSILLEMILLSELFQLIVPIDGFDLYNIQQVNFIFSLFVQVICFILAGIFIIMIMREIYRIIDKYYEPKLSREMIKFYEEIDNITECHNDYL